MSPWTSPRTALGKLDEKQLLAHPACQGLLPQQPGSWMGSRLRERTLLSLGRLEDHSQGKTRQLCLQATCSVPARPRFGAELRRVSPSLLPVCSLTFLSHAGWQEKSLLESNYLNIWFIIVTGDRPAHPSVSN